MIVTDLGEAGLEDMDDMVREGVASFKLFMAYPGVLMVDDATIFQALERTAKNGALICLHAENGGIIDVIVKRAIAEGKTAPIYHAPDASRRGRSGSGASRGGHVGNFRRAGVHRASFFGRGAERSARGARPRRADFRRNLPAVFIALDRRSGAARF